MKKLINKIKNNILAYRDAKRITNALEESKKVYILKSDVHMSEELKKLLNKKGVKQARCLFHPKCYKFVA